MDSFSVLPQSQGPCQIAVVLRCKIYMIEILILVHISSLSQRKKDAEC